MDHITSTQQWPKWSEQYNAGDITTADETGNDLPVGKKQNHVKGLSCVWLRQLIILRKKEKAAFAAWKKLFFLENKLAEKQQRLWISKQEEQSRSKPEYAVNTLWKVRWE